MAFVLMNIILLEHIHFSTFFVTQADKIQKICSAANVQVEPFWPGLFAKALEGRNIGDLISNVGSAPAAGVAPAGGGMITFL